MFDTAVSKGEVFFPLKKQLKYIRISIKISINALFSVCFCFFHITQSLAKPLYKFSFLEITFFFQLGHRLISLGIYSHKISDWCKILSIIIFNNLYITIPTPCCPIFVYASTIKIGFQMWYGVIIKFMHFLHTDNIKFCILVLFQN